MDNLFTHMAQALTQNIKEYKSLEGSLTPEQYVNGQLSQAAEAIWHGELKDELAEIGEAPRDYDSQGDDIANKNI